MLDINAKTQQDNFGNSGIKISTFKMIKKQRSRERVKKQQVHIFNLRDRVTFLSKLCLLYNSEAETSIQLSIEPRHEKSIFATANNKVADQPAHPSSLMSAFIVFSLEDIISRVFIYEI